MCIIVTFGCRFAVALSDVLVISYVYL